MTKLSDVLVSEDIMEIVQEEVASIRRNPDRSPADIAKLEKLTKVYSTLMANNREMIKSGLLGQLTTEDLDDPANDAEDDGEDAE